jgi:hypothetical protein
MLSAALVVAVLAGCGGGQDTHAPLPATAPSVGPDARFRPPSLSAHARRAAPIDGLRCTRRAVAHYGVHLELFSQRRVVLVPPGIGIAPPRRARGAYIRGGRCSYPLRTREPTGVVEVEPHSPPHTLGELFAVWGQPISRTRMAGFRGRVSAYVGGRAWREDPRAIPLGKHAQIVLEVGGCVRPHAAYRFPSGL